MTSDYRPIACGLYDQFELWASHAEPLELETEDDRGRRRRLSGRALDLRVGQGAEYLLLEDDGGKRHELRLDRLLWVRSRRDGRTWRQETDAGGN